MGIVTVLSQICVVLIEIAPVEGNEIIALFKSPIMLHLLPTWESGT